MRIFNGSVAECRTQLEGSDVLHASMITSSQEVCDNWIISVLTSTVAIYDGEHFLEALNRELN